MIALVVLIALELMLVGYIASRIMRYQAIPSPTLRAATFTATALLLAMLSVTEPVEVVLRGPDAISVWLPTLLKHLGILWCGAGVLLLALAQRQLQRPAAEMAVWLWCGVSALSVIVLHLLSGGGGRRTSVEYVDWSHTQPPLVAAMMITYVGGFAASLGLFAVIWPLHLRSAAGRGLAIMAVGAALFAVWCVVRVSYSVEAALTTSTPRDGDLLVTQLLSLVGLLFLTVGLVWSTAEADITAQRDWRKFRYLHQQVLQAVPEVRRGSDRRLGRDAWASDRAVEVLDGLHLIEQQHGTKTGFPQAPEHGSDGELTTAAARIGRQYETRRPV